MVMMPPGRRATRQISTLAAGQPIKESIIQAAGRRRN
jgi:hypothetical protein